MTRPFLSWAMGAQTTGPGIPGGDAWYWPGGQAAWAWSRPDTASAPSVTISQRLCATRVVENRAGFGIVSSTSPERTVTAGSYR